MTGPFVQLADPAPQILAYLGVERPEWFVQQEHAGLDGQCARERHALLLTAGELCGMPTAELGELDEIEQMVHAFGSRRSRVVWSAEGR
jgi:hypothetical protein